MPDTDLPGPEVGRHELINQLIRETSAAARPDVSVLVAAALLAASADDLLAEAMQVASTTADRQFVAIAVAHLAGDHDRVDALARDHFVDHAPRPVLVWIVNHSHDITINQGAHR